MTFETLEKQGGAQHLVIYLDHAATTPMRPEAREAVAASLGVVGNPSAIHSAGQQAKRVLEEARERVAVSLGCDPVEVIFTSGGTESINLGIKGLFWAARRESLRVSGSGSGSGLEVGAGPMKNRILVPEGEHHATLDTVQWLAGNEGAVIDWLPLDAAGRLRLDALEAALAASDNIALLTLLQANNEVGTVQPVAGAVALATRHGVPVHLDAVAGYGQLPIDFAGSGLAALSVSAHKIGGPHSIGALIAARTARLEALIHGGNQQRLRSGTQDVAAAAGFAAAAAFAHGKPLREQAARLAVLRERLIAGVREVVPDAVLRGGEARLAGNVHFTFPGCEGDSLLFLLDMAGIAVSTGSACQAGVPEVSHVLRALGVPEREARGALRFSLGHSSTEADVDVLIAALPAAYQQAVKAGLSSRAGRG